MKLSVVIPAHNEAGQIEANLRDLSGKLDASGIEHEIIVVNDHSLDETELLLQKMSREHRAIRYLNNPYGPGFGLAVRTGLEHFSGDAVAIYMADASDRPEDLIAFYARMIIDEADCVFGSRFIEGGRVLDYPGPKLLLNRLANTFIRGVFGIRYNDVTNAFKLYRRHVIDGVQPLLSHHFNLTVELPLKAIVRGYRYSVVPNQWINRKTGESKLKIKEMGSRYLFIVLYCFIEKWLSRGDYRHNPKQEFGMRMKPGAGDIAEGESRVKLSDQRLSSK
jgi:dolichol-phosphate mannosyltransferase